MASTMQRRLYQQVDVYKRQIYEYMPKEFQMLLIASAAGIMEKNVDNQIGRASCRERV